ncbi:ABC peptide transporter, periplasmic binding protein [Halanaerobium saccharolyticum subsp. saccharolyticum DSM 6643]|uniref:ABC peptide transporter, periplasmic binding protein n=1 Tax=Halanaerobium saccharolyticum subsp. saccharolyticum DSM 6643 TaxID=1293054 RepID=M5DYF8_9FIRM|nr:ABC transporter substrate-binding protein [Halanaerobium saccharolyticum]CCU78016.1 ABC peptide transporter, periplasmic binding protein [Halanaerobium saccharolyticum subsp. saccharolyticum DSM 6643]
MKKIKIIILVLLIIITGVYTVNAENYGGDLKVKINKRPLNLNPIYSFNQTEKIINSQIFDKLLVLNNKGEIVNNLSKSWEINENSTVFSFILKKDVYFHPYKRDGKEIPLEQRKVTAEDWKWSFEYLANPENKSPNAEIFNKVLGYDDYRQQKEKEITGIRVIDDYQLEIELKKPYAPFIYNLVKEAAVVIPKQAVLNTDQNFALAPVGTGAFKLKEFLNNKIVLTENKNYWKNNYQKEKLPYLKKIDFYFNESNDLNSNYQDFDLYQLEEDQFTDYQHQKNIKNNYSFKKIVDNNIYFAAFNYKNNFDLNPNFKERNEKIKSILNKNEFIQNLNLNNFSYLKNGSNDLKILNKINYQNQQLSKQELNINKKYLLEIAINNSKLNNKISQLIKKELKSNYIDLDINEYNWTKYLNILKDDLNGQLFIMTYNYNNKFNFITDNFYSESENNYFNYENRRLDNLIDYIKLTKNENKQDKAYEIIEEILLNDNPFIFILQSQDNYLITNQLLNQDIFENIYTRNNFELLYFK